MGLSSSVLWVCFYWPSPFPLFPRRAALLLTKTILYYKALVAVLNEMPKPSGNVPSGFPGGVPTDYYHVIVEANYEFTPKLPAQVGEHTIEYLDYQGLVDRCHRLRKEFSIYVIHAVQNEGTHLKINITVHWMNFKKKRLIYSLEGGTSVTFRYDCEKQAFVIDSVKSRGI
jgi:hypothetical protein